MFRRLRRALIKFCSPRKRDNRSEKHLKPIQLSEIGIVLNEEPVKLSEYPVHAATPALEPKDYEAEKNPLESVALRSPSDSINSSAEPRCKESVSEEGDRKEEENDRIENETDRKEETNDKIENEKTESEELVNEEDRKEEENDKLEIKTDKKEETNDTLDNEKAESEELVIRKAENKESNNEEKETNKTRNRESFTENNQVYEESLIRQPEILQDSQKPCESKENSVVRFSPQCPVDSVIVESTPVPERTSVSWTSVEDYDLQSLLGEGGFGKVYLAQHKCNGKKVAIKALKKEGIKATKQVSRLNLERSILEEAKREKNPFLVGLFASFRTEHHLCLVMDYCAGGDLDSYFKHGAFSRERAVFYAGCVVLGLQFLHTRNIIHRDIKPENVLLDSDGYAKITDFGIAIKTMGFDGKTMSKCGSCYYLAPEIFGNHGYRKSVDWWALGVMIYEMLLKQMPFNGRNKEKIFNSIINKEPKYPKKLGEDATIIIKQLLRKDPDMRIGSSERDAEEVKECSFFKELDFEALSKKQINPPFIPKQKTPGCFCKFRHPKQVVLSSEQYKPPLIFVEKAFEDFDCFVEC
ncbi:hypothetical protein XENTR_v10000901 [Xenopus tropicalis]|nr:hypothetical protein XENTR_v10000901 [Xenopus tropicalis]